MAGKSKSGQRADITSASGRKERSPTSQTHKGSRVEPSHLTEQARDSREKKTARKAAKKPSKNRL